MAGAELSLVAFSGASGLRIDEIDQRITFLGIEGERYFLYSPTTKIIYLSQGRI